MRSLIILSLLLSLSISPVCAVEDGLGTDHVVNLTASGTVQGATYGSDGTVTDAELLRINSLTSNAQDQITTKGAHAGQVWTGAHDFGGATSLKVPNSDAPTVDAAGEIAFDNNLWAAGRGASVLYDGTASTAILSALVSDAPANGEVPKWNTGGTITWETDNNTAGLTGTDTHVLFFDGGDNAVGEAGMTYNKTTATLSVGAVETAPTATPTIANYDSDGTDGDISSQ